MNLTPFLNAANCRHNRNVSAVSGLLAKLAGYPPGEAALIEQAALYHDVGKLDLPPGLLDKPGALTAREFEIVKTHTRLGYERIAGALRVLSAAGVICRDHHERVDGTGYRGLAAGEIHPYAKLVAVADVLDALASRRPYKEPWEKSEVLDYFKSRSGIQFDPEFCNILATHANEIFDLCQ